jgi:hypothetical protein
MINFINRLVRSSFEFMKATALAVREKLVLYTQSQESLMFSELAKLRFVIVIPESIGTRLIFKAAHPLEH